MIRALHIDGSFLAYSRFKAGADMPRHFLRRLEELRATHDPRVTIVAWDTPSGTLKRRQLHADYKAGRPEKEPAYFDQLAELQAELRHRGVGQARSATGEADDVIATLVRTTPGPHLIYSADKDLLQLLAPDVTMIKAPGSRGGAELEITHTNLPDTRIKLAQTWVEGLGPAGWGDLLALAGDPGDHIPGIPGIGPVKGLQLLEACPKLVWLVLQDTEEADDAVRAAVAAANPRLVKYALRTIAHRDDLRVSKALVDLRTLDDLEWD